MGFCDPGTGTSGDLPPRPECASAWRSRVLEALPNIELTIVLGQYAQAYHLPGKRRSVTDAVKAWRESWPAALPLPHPSRRNQGWFKKNAWFEREVLPALRDRVHEMTRA